MGPSPPTRPSLLLRLRDAADAEAWNLFVDLYAPLVYGFLRKQGLQDADAADVTQEVLQAVARSVGRLDYDPVRGSFRGWLFTVVRNELRDFLAARRRQQAGSGDSAVRGLLEAVPAPEPDLAAQWEREHQQRLLDWAGGQVRRSCQETTWQAFWLTAVQGRSGQEAARRLGLSVAAVYLAKRRVLRRLAEELRRLEEDIDPRETPCPLP
jgi:RNA polymerase sigma factor (sigma-70 family)